MGWWEEEGCEKEGGGEMVKNKKDGYCYNFVQVVLA